MKHNHFKWYTHVHQYQGQEGTETDIWVIIKKKGSKHKMKLVC